MNRLLSSLLLFCIAFIPRTGNAITPDEVVQIIKNKQNYPNYVLVAAHRGYWADYPENSQGAYEMAIELDVDIVEMDVRLTKDGQMVIFHDACLDRVTTGYGRLRDTNWSEVQQLYLVMPDGRRTYDKMLTLEQALDSLKGKAVVVTSGTTSEVLLNKLNEEQKMNMRIISAKDHGDSFRTLESGRAVAFMMDDALLAGERAKAKKPDNWDIVGKPQSQEAYGCMLRKDDPQFKKLMDDTIAQVQTSGEAEKWFDKWFKNPIPPKNLNMNFELSDEMKALFKEPNDKALN